MVLFLGSSEHRQVPQHHSSLTLIMPLTFLFFICGMLQRFYHRVLYGYGLYEGTVTDERVHFL